MKYLLFDYQAVFNIISLNYFQSVEYQQGSRLAKHFCGELNSDIMGDVAIEYLSDGILFVGKGNNNIEGATQYQHYIFCIDLTTCNILNEKNDLGSLLTVIQKVLRTVIKIWNRQPFSSSERIYKTKIAVLPFVYPDRRKVIIERSLDIRRFKKRDIEFPLLAYKYTSDDPREKEQPSDNVLKNAGDDYRTHCIRLQNLFSSNINSDNIKKARAISVVNASTTVNKEGFIYLNYDTQLKQLTDTQKQVVESDNLKEPLRIDGAAGTGKTMSLIMRAYKLLKQYKNNGHPFKIIFLAHSMSTNRRNKSIFELYPESEYFLKESSPQSIIFYTLLEYCIKVGNVPYSSVLDIDADAAKTYQLMIMDSVWKKSENESVIQTYKPLLSERMRDFLTNEKNTNVIYNLLQHEFSVQIKGRTDGSIDDYLELESISNGLPCTNRKDKEFIFHLYQFYQNELANMGSYDVDDVVIEALAKLNGPIWRRERINGGYDYILVDEMHLFNINEQSVFHFLPKNMKNEIPICFALDYSQAIGDRGNTDSDYIEKVFGNIKDKKNYKTVFRNSLDITNLCASIATSGALMFQNAFFNPYMNTQSSFTENDEKKSKMPTLYMYFNDDEMISSLKYHIGNIIQELQCDYSDIAIVIFDNKYLKETSINKIKRIIGKDCQRINMGDDVEKGKISLASPYDVNGLEFQAVILLGVDEGRVPQTAGTNDVSQHFVRYSAYNMLYLVCSRAKYRVLILGSKLNTISSCLKHSIDGQYLQMEEDCSAK